MLVNMSSSSSITDYTFYTALFVTPSSIVSVYVVAMVARVATLPL